MNKGFFKIADLFCGGGGAAKGLMDAGFEVVGFDINDQSRYYPGEFRQGNALAKYSEFLGHQLWDFIFEGGWGD